VGGGTVPPSGNAISDGIWHHVAVSRESTTGNTLVYVDGIRTGPAFWPGATGPMSAASELHVGELLSGLSHYEGLIDELGIYDRVLTPTEVYQLATPTDPAFDQRGMPWSRVVGGRIDIGAVESQANPLAGDYNFDGIVNAADSSVWRNTVGSKNDLRADGSGEEFGVPDGVVDELDYAFWKASFGNVLEAGGGASSLSTAGQGSSGTREALAEPVAPGPSQLAGELRLAAPIVVDSAKRSSPADETIVNGKATTSDLRSDGALVAWLAARTTPKSRDDGAIASATHDQNAEEGEFCTALDRVFQLLGDE